MTTIPTQMQYEFVTSRMKDLAGASLGSLKLFVPMYWTIWVGSIWLRLKTTGLPVPEMYKASLALMALLTVVCTSFALYKMCAWLSYRSKLVRLVGKAGAIPPRSGVIDDLIISIGVLAAGCLFLIFNPFASVWCV
jgi:hypothetical protein